MVKVNEFHIYSHRHGWVEFIVEDDSISDIHVGIAERSRNEKYLLPSLTEDDLSVYVDHGLPLEKEFEEPIAANTRSAIRQIANTFNNLMNQFDHRVMVEQHLRQHPELLIVE